MAGTAPTGCNDGDAQHNADPPRTNRENDDADLDELLNENDSGGSAGIDTDDTPDAPNPKPEVMNDESVPAVAAQPIKEGPRSEDTPASAEGVSGIAAPGVGSTDKATADTDVSTSNTSASAAQEEDGGWGLSSVTAALGGGWGFGAGADPGVESATTGTEEEQQDDEWKHQAETIEETAAAAVAAASSFFSGTAVTGTTATSSTEETEAAPAREAKEDEEWNEKAENVEHVIEDATAAAAAAASSFFSGATEYLTGGSATAAEAAPEATTASTSTSADPTAAALRSLADLNPMSKLASGWIDDLEKQNAESDPHRKLRDHLDGHLGEWPRSSYEEWVEEALRVLDGWDDGSAVVDDTFYMEDSVHRNIWNERNAEDDDGVECKREYVSARKPISTDASGSSATKVVPKTIDKKKTAEVVSSGDSEDADLAGLLGDEEEIVFVDAPKSG